jgi:S-adenosyl methyltransferase
VGNVHEIAHQLDPASRVVYVDIEPVAVATTQHMLQGLTNVAVVHADMRDVDTVLNAPATRALIDFAKPVGLMVVAALHFVSVEEDLTRMLAGYRAVLAPGSYLAISHTTWDPRPEVEAAMQRLFKQTASPVIHRSREEVAALLDGLELVEPGVVWTPQWQPDDDTDPLFATPERSATFAAVARIPG